MRITVQIYEQNGNNFSLIEIEFYYMRNLEGGFMETDKEPKKIINHPDWEIYWPKRVTWVGFIIVWVVVLFTIIGTMILARIGS